ncbi:MAG: hypothetical protein ACO3OY_08250 [bacterium]|nr:hypothetical protein [SAR324 cluster bacterium]
MLIQERFDSSGVVWHIDGWQISKILFLPLVLLSFPMENSKSWQRSERVQIIPDQMIHDLEDKQLDLSYRDYQKTLGSYRKKRFWPMILSFAGFWLILPPWLFFKFFRRRFPEWQYLHELKVEIHGIKKNRKRRKFFDRLRKSKNLVQTSHPQELKNLYRNLVDSSRQYNLRVGLFDHALERQQKELDQPFSEQEFDQIENTFLRLYNELNSAFSLFKLAEENTNLDLVTLIHDQYAGFGPSAEFIQHSQNLGQSGQFVQELLLLEAQLHREIQDFSQLNQSSQDAS